MNHLSLSLFFSFFPFPSINHLINIQPHSVWHAYLSISGHSGPAATCSISAIAVTQGSAAYLFNPLQIFHVLSRLLEKLSTPCCPSGKECLQANSWLPPDFKCVLLLQCIFAASVPLLKPFESSRPIRRSGSSLTSPSTTDILKQKEMLTKPKV